MEKTENVILLVFGGLGIISLSLNITLGIAIDICAHASNTEWVKATQAGEDMKEDSPNRRYSIITVTPSNQEEIDSKIYVAWKLSMMSWQEILTQFPLSLFWAFLIGLLTKAVYDRLIRKKKKKRID